MEVNSRKIQMQTMEILDIKRKYDKLKKAKFEKKEKFQNEDMKPKTFHDIGRDRQFEQQCDKWNATDTRSDYDDILQQFDQ